MRNGIIGIVIGVVVGVVIGATVIAPRLALDSPPSSSKESADVPALVAAPAVFWRMASAYPSTLPQLGSLAKRVEKEIWRLSAGAMQIKFHEPDALAPTTEMFDAVASGTIDAAFSSPGLWGGRVSALQLFSAVPFGPSPEEYLAWLYFGGGGKLFEDIYHKHGIHGIPCGVISSEASGWFRREIKTLEDLKGVKMRFFGLGAKVMAKLGVNTRSLNGGDTFVAFESGGIDAAEFSMPAIDLKLGFHKVAKHYYMPGWHQPATLLDLMINLDRWQSLSSANKSRIEAVCGDNVRFGLAEGGALQFPALKELTAKGVSIHRWPTEILEALHKAWQEVAAQEAKDDLSFKRVWKSLSAFRNDYAIWRELAKP